MSVTLIEGIGFGEQSNFQNELSLFSIDARSVDLDQLVAKDLRTSLPTGAVVVFRSRWSATVEERIFIKTLVKRHQASLEVLSELLKEKKISVVAIGRGAVLWLEWLKQSGVIESELNWTPEAFNSNSWIDTKVHTLSNTTVSIRAMVSGRAFLARPNFGGHSVRTWVDFGDRNIGWVIHDNLYLSPVDVFSLSERAQLPDFGYEDLSMISTRSNLLQMIMTGQM
ncbi:MAG TPA: hypothetical protein VM901_01315 [Bdellovibrionota bacterium]|jgi:hypothetical protein|nr:hypothetical protein [Bdellovibrionota bacterium]